jgi:hypothetical protein
MNKRSKSDEQKVADNIGKLVSDLRIDLEMVGFYLAYYLPNVAFRRLEIIMESAKEYKQKHSQR